MTTKTRLMRRRRAPCRKGWSPEERLAYHTKADPLSGCLIWQGALNSDGYGRAYFHGRDYRAHRWAWIIKHGRIPDDMVVCHRCDERRCVNTDHLFVDTHSANMSDMTAKWHRRRTLGIGSYKMHGGLPPDAELAEIAPISHRAGSLRIARRRRPSATRSERDAAYPLALSTCWPSAASAVATMCGASRPASAYCLAGEAWSMKRSGAPSAGPSGHGRACRPSRDAAAHGWRSRRSSLPRS